MMVFLTAFFSRPAPPHSLPFRVRFSFRAAESLAFQTTKEPLLFWLGLGNRVLLCSLCSFVLWTLIISDPVYETTPEGRHQLRFPALPVCACLHDVLPSHSIIIKPAWLPRYAVIVNMADTRTRGSSRSPARGVRNRSRSRERERARERETNENKVSIDREKV